MENELKTKLKEISNIWSGYIWKFNYCSQKVLFTEEVRTNYFGDMIVYFQDTFEIILRQKSKKIHLNNFERNIVLLQAIYVQQDFVEELLYIFKTGINKGDLKQNSDYSINRQIRNELIGHPIRRVKGKLESSTIFGLNNDTENINYLIYHVDNSFKIDERTYNVSEIIERHFNFLNTYFDKIIFKLNSILKAFYQKLLNLEEQISKQEFKKLLQIIGVYYEFIFKTDYAYDKDSLISIYEKVGKHERYSHFIDCFIKDLKIGIVESKLDIFSKLGDQNSLNTLRSNCSLFFDNDGTLDTNGGQSLNYFFEKLNTNRNNETFDMNLNILKSKFHNSPKILAELNFLEENWNNLTDYYPALKYIEKIIIH